MDKMGDENHLSENSEFLRLRNKVILALLYSSGLRVSELVMLHSDSIDLSDRTIRIRGKGEKDRIVLFDGKTKELLENYLKIRGDHSDYLFVNRSGNHLTPRYIQMMIKDYAKAAGSQKKSHTTYIKAFICNSSA